MNTVSRDIRFSLLSGRLPRFMLGGAIVGALSGIIRPELGVTRWRATRPRLNAGPS